MVESYPPSDLTLYREDTIVASSRTSGGLPDQRLSVHLAQNSLKVEIRELLLQDEGQYRCLANNTYGRSTASIHFGVDSARITIDPGLDIQEGATANLTCVVASRAAGEMNYTWYKNGRHVREGPDPSLLLDGVARDDAGSYQCQAEGMMGRVTSALVNLNVHCECSCDYPPRKALVKSFLETQKGKLAVIVCTVESNPISMLSLRRANQVLAASSSQLNRALDHKLKAASSPNSLRLEIKEVSPDDEGTYECLASNGIGQTSTSLDFTVETTRVVIQPISDVREGEHVSLTCEDTASMSNSLYTWYKNAKWLIEDSAPSLQFHAVSASDMGTYSCQVRSERGIRTSPPAALHVLCKYLCAYGQNSLLGTITFATD
ncbi:sialoadhesin-like [Sceloporus undulatus]|uniref:sialoadhesin-like n=1 Tax=Sceloporus undulatus TaxID=8520 RepID=UPI001C4CE5C5|nr:sialoadhesin-like [Sceloporus undulatus]